MKKITTLSLIVLMLAGCSHQKICMPKEQKAPMVIVERADHNRIAKDMGWCDKQYEFETASGIVIWYEYDSQGNCVSRAKEFK